MRSSDYLILNKFSRQMNFHPFHLEIILKSLEFYMLVIKQQYNDNLIDTKKYDELYFELYLLYHTFMFALAEVPSSYRAISIPLYKRIDNRNNIKEALKKFKVS